MNVLILTPDAVGSTLLQRLITIYMQFQQYNQPIINLHELTNGLSKYYSPDFNREIVGKPDQTTWGYYQTLEEIVNLLKPLDKNQSVKDDNIIALLQFHQLIDELKSVK